MRNTEPTDAELEFMDKMRNIISQPKYGITESGIFGLNVVSGIITGITFTEEKPIYELSFGKNKYNVNKIFDSKEDLFSALNIADLSKVKETHGLKIKYEL